MPLCTQYSHKEHWIRYVSFLICCILTNFTFYPSSILLYSVFTSVLTRHGERKTRDGLPICLPKMSLKVLLAQWKECFVPAIYALTGLRFSSCLGQNEKRYSKTWFYDRHWLTWSGKWYNVYNTYMLFLFGIKKKKYHNSWNQIQLESAILFHGDNPMGKCE